MDTVGPLPNIIVAPVPVPLRSSTSAEWDVANGKAAEAAEKEKMKTSVRAGLIRKVSYGGVAASGDGEIRSPLMKRRSIDGGDGIPQARDREVEHKEDAERRQQARIVDGQMTAEQLRRMAEDSAAKTAAAKLEADERKKAAAKVKAEEESERLRRIQEHSTLTIEAQSEHAEAERAKAKAIGAITVEQNRRLAEAAALKSEAKAEEIADRKKALAEVRAAEEAERQRRMHEREGEFTPAIVLAQERHERKKSVDLAVLLMEAERARRLADVNHDKEGEQDEQSKEAVKVWVEKEVEKERGRRMSWGTRPAGLLAAIARPI